MKVALKTKHRHTHTHTHSHRKNEIIPFVEREKTSHHLMWNLKYDTNLFTKQTLIQEKNLWLPTDKGIN